MHPGPLGSISEWKRAGMSGKGEGWVKQDDTRRTQVGSDLTLQFSSLVQWLSNRESRLLGRGHGDGGATLSVPGQQEGVRAHRTRGETLRGSWVEATEGWPWAEGLPPPH